MCDSISLQSLKNTRLSSSFFPIMVTRQKSAFVLKSDATNLELVPAFGPSVISAIVHAGIT